MRRYEALLIEISRAADVLTVSSEVTTVRIDFPWGNLDASAEGVSFAEMDAPDEVGYNLD